MELRTLLGARLSQDGLNLISHLSHLCLTPVSCKSHLLLTYVSLLSQHVAPDCESVENRTDVYSGNSRRAATFATYGICGCFVVRQKKTADRKENPKKSNRSPHPEGASCVVALRGPAPPLAPGTLRPPVSVRGTLTKSAGRPRRRSRWERPPHTKPVGTSKAKGRPRAAFCFGGWFRSVRCCR